MPRVYYTILIYIKPGQEATFRSYEHQALPLMARYGGRVELFLQPDTVTGDLDRPDEIHVLSFETDDGYARYRQDPRSIELAPLRLASVDKAIFLKGRRLPAPVGGR